MSLLTIEHLSVRFGGVVAVNDVSFSIPENTIYSVIGPNGAGKTTLFNLITGIYKAQQGSIRFNGEQVLGCAPHQLAQKGLSRTFQNLQVCMNMTALENVMVGAHLRLNRNIILSALAWTGITRADRALKEEAQQLMAFVGLENVIDAEASSLSYGVLKRLEIARALAMQPKILFLDEPTAGLNPSETIEITALLQKIKASGMTMVLVEHDMKMVMTLSDRILVLNYGQKLAEGDPVTIRNHPEVIRAYLGHQASGEKDES